MIRLFNTVAFRLAMGYGILVLCAVAVISMILYLGTVGVLDREINAKLLGSSDRLNKRFEEHGIEGVQQGIDQLLTDGVDSDTEVYLLVGPDGKKIIGNIDPVTGSAMRPDHLVDERVIRNGRLSISRLLPHELSNGAVLIVGRDMQDLHEISELVLRSIGIGGVLALVIAIGGAILFRNQLERRVAAIRHTVLEIEAGDLSRRIPVLDSDDEFTRLNHDINHMLDQIQHLMEGVRNVSNAIAHDLRTPLGRIRSLLDEALSQERNREKLSTAATAAIRQIDDLTIVFDKLLQIAEAESGTRRQSFQPVALKEIVTDVVEFYDAAAEAKGIRLTIGIEGDPTTLGDKDLLASATANLLDNALKYAGNDSTVRVRAVQDRHTVSIVVQDNGPGIPSGEREKVMTRFYRGDQSRTLPGNGLGLPIVSSISHLHSGTFALEDAHPGLAARIVLPRARP
ncbi:MAG TPA: HAMP domain-containing sensor histidine kinase [Chthoniobacterales bacterium]|jgi:signal transduction histidine kinase|nr:HAMP domain-containing sensor histidine kinase [Chthoniobacterales bacterium]